MMLSPEPSSDREVPVLPRWLLRHIVQAENHRVPEKFKPYSHSHFGGYGNTYWGSHNRIHTVYPERRWNNDLQRWEDVPKEPQPLRVAHLDANDYRLWSEVRTPLGAAAQIMARCRWCYERFSIREFAEARGKHKDLCHFTHNLREIYSILLQRGQCTVCGRQTKENKWGVPLCRPECRVEWMFAGQNTEEMGRAIIAARLAKRLKENVGSNRGRTLDATTFD